MPQITVGEKALAHLSRGLYRSPASALRELVSNAWDANARSVTISTNAPNFHALSVTDNGYGFPQEEFARLMEGGIGNSLKRPKDMPLINERPIIGRLGIGMLGIAQICGSFTIQSKTRDGTGFKARIHFYDLLKERLDRNDTNIVKMTEEDAIEEVEVGEYNFLEFDPTKASVGTKIYTDDLHPTFIRSFQDSVNHENYFDPPLNWADAVTALSEYATLHELGDYWRLLWELSASCPIPYINGDALPDHLVTKEHKTLEGYDFKVVVDGIELFKPVYLKDNPAGYTTLKIARQEKQIYGRLLSFRGYIAVQEGTQLKPDEVRGILIRIKNIAIGYYDPSLLDYRYNEGPRSRWLTAEIYVDEGLENALNIDRDSFNRFHPEFRYLQTYIHRLLQKEIFPEVYRQIDVRSRARAAKKQEARLTHFHKTVETQAQTKAVVKFRPIPKGADLDIKIERKKNRIEITLPEPETLRTKKSQRQLAAAILGIYALAAEEKAVHRRFKVFSDQLLQLLSKW